MPARGKEKESSDSTPASLLVEQRDLGLSLQKCLAGKDSFRDWGHSNRCQHTFLCAAWLSAGAWRYGPLELVRTELSSCPALKCPPSPPPSIEICLILTPGLTGQLSFHFSLPLRGYKINSDLEGNSGILIRTIELEAKRFCVDKTKTTLRVAGSQLKGVMTVSSLMAARHKRGYSPNLS